MNTQISGPYCPISSHLRDLSIPWVPAEETNVAETFKREMAKLRSPYYESAYDEVERHHYMMFPGGFER